MIRTRNTLMGKRGPNGAASAIPPFVPTDIAGLQLWLDASDAATITETAGAVSQWNDKSGNSRNYVQATGAKQPMTGTATINGLNAIQFDGVDDTMTSSAFMYALGTMTLYIMFDSGVTTGERFFIGDSNTGTDAPMYRFGPANSQMRSYLRNSASSVRFNTTGTTNIQGGDGNFVTVVDAGTQIDQYVNGLPETSVAYTRSGVVTLNINAIGCLKRLAETGFYLGSIGEILVYQGAHDSAQRAQVEGYIRDKWMASGIVAMEFLLGESNADGRADTTTPGTDITTFYGTDHNNLQVYFKPATRTAGTVNAGSFALDGGWWYLGLTHNTTTSKTHQTIGNAGSSVGTQSNVWFGIELEYARQFYNDNPTDSLWFIKAAVGGSSLNTDWRVVTPDGTCLWTWFLNSVYTPAYNMAIAKNKTPVMRGVTIFNGINDANPTDSAVYGTNLQEMIDRLNTELFDVPEKIAIIGMPSTLVDADSLVIKAAQISVAGANPNTVYIATDGSGVNPAVPMQGDNIHYTTGGINTIAGYVYDEGA